MSLEPKDVLSADPVDPDEPERRLTAFQHVLVVLVPVGILAAGFLSLWAWRGLDYANQMAIATAATIFGLGTTVILGGAVLGNQGLSLLTTADLAWLVIVIGTMLAFVYVYSMDLIERLPRLGPILRKSRKEAVETVQHRPWIRRWATFGVGFFVLTPLPGSGALGGALVGRLVGLSNLRTFSAVAGANLVVCWLYAAASGPIRAWTESMTLLEKLLGIALALGVFFAVGRWVATLAKRPDDAPAAAPGSEDARGPR